MTRRVQRTDISTLRPVERRSDGTIIADAHLTRCGVFQYIQPDGTLRRELRRREDVFDPESLRSFEGRPVTNDHPPGMLDARNARQFAVGSQFGAITRDDDHVRGRLSVYDYDTVAAMEAGKTQVSCGYTCDCIEEPGVDPVYGPYDAIQTHIRGNHIAIVDRGRAGLTAAARMDGMMVESGTALAMGAGGATLASTMPNSAARLEVVVRTDKQEPGASVTVDPNDVANRGAKGENDAPKHPKRQPGQFQDRGGDIVHGSQPDDDDYACEETESNKPDAYDMSYDDGELTAAARDKIKASNFAVPEGEKLPIHDKGHLKAAMSRFGQTDFASADQKHAAFNRIVKRAKDFGVNSEGFQKAHQGKLDKLDREDIPMTEAEKKAKAEKKAARKAKMDAAEKAAETAKAESARKDGEIENLKAKVAALETEKKAHADTAEKSFAARVDAKAALLESARSTGAKVESTMSDRQIRVAVIKHVTKADIADDKHDAYVEARYEGALEQSKKDATDAAKGAGAIAAARAAASPVDGTKPLPEQQRGDTAATDTSEEAAKARLRQDSASAWMTPSLARKENK